MYNTNKPAKDEIKVRQAVKNIKHKATYLGIDLTTRDNRFAVFKHFPKDHVHSLAKIRIMQEFPEPKPQYIKQSFYSQHGLRPMPWIRRFIQWIKNYAERS